jgi:hypothetical protein
MMFIIHTQIKKNIHNFTFERENLLMKHIGAILLKYVMVAVILEIVLGWLTGNSFTNILVISAAVTVVSYLVGDLLILAKSNNTITTIFDGVVTLIVLLLFNYARGYSILTFTTALISTVVLAVGEIFFHRFVVRNVLPETNT